MINEAFILGLDISSTAIGYVLRNGVVFDRGVIRLNPKAHIGARCVAARDALAALLDQHVVDAIAVESPVARFASAIIPQCRVSGIALELAERRGIVACEITPAEAKKALAGDGDASKEQMLIAAARHFGFAADALTYIKRRGDWIALMSGMVVYTEHEADALGVAMAAAGKVEVTHAGV